jgi:outer membrane protein assembly factor BamA
MATLITNKKLVITFILLLSVFTTQASDTLQQQHAKKGWNFGVLPSIAFDADLGFQYGALTNIYNYGDGSQYPEYLHSFYLEAAYATKQNGIVRFLYDSKYLIPDHRLTVDVSYLPDAMCDFYGYNGHQSVFHSQWTNSKNVNVDYRSRVFYKHKRDIYRFAGDIEGSVSNSWKWNGGIGLLGYDVASVDIARMNRGKDSIDKLPDIQNLYDKYVVWNIIKEDEKSGGWHPYIRGGFAYDTRDTRVNPSRGIHAEAFFTYYAAFNRQNEYNNLKFNFNFKHFIPLYKKSVTFAYRIGTQTNIAGKTPFYLNTYLNTLFIQRALYEALGGGNSLRGVLRNRILVDGYAYFNVEIRAKLWRFDIAHQHFYIGLNPFVDAGIVLQPYQLDEAEIMNTIAKNNTENNQNDKIEDYFDFGTSCYKPHFAAGAGLKIAMNENFILSVDWAAPFDKQDNSSMANFYIKMGFLF